MVIFSLVLSTFMLVNPFIENKQKEILIEEYREIGYRPVVSEPFELGSKRMWYVKFMLKGERDKNGSIGLYEKATDSPEGIIFKTFTEEEIITYTRVAFYTGTETEESVSQSVQNGEIFVTAFYYLCPDGRVEPFYVASQKNLIKKRPSR